MSGCNTERWTLEELCSALQNQNKDNKRIVVPMFQRGLRWNKSQKQTFIDSLERGYPVGTMLFYEQITTDSRTYILVDGLQRSNCIRSYINNPSEYLGESSISDLCCEKILQAIEKDIEQSDYEIIKEIVLEFIRERKTFKNLQYFDVAKKIIKKYGSSLENADKLINIFTDFFSELQKRYDNIASTVIPVIVYTGDSKNLPDIFDRINSKGTPLDQYEVYAASWPVDKKFKIDNNEIIEHIINKYESFINDGYIIEGYSRNAIRNNHLVSAFEYLFGLSRYIASKYEALAFNTNISVDAVNPLAYELVNACLNDSNKIATLYENIYSLDVNLLEKQIENAIEFVLQAISPIAKFKSNKHRGKNKIYHSKFQIMSMISTTFKEMFKHGAESDTWKENKKILQKNLLHYYIYDILTDWWSEGGTGKIYQVAKPNRYLSNIPPQTWAVALNGYFEKTIQRKECEKIASVKSEEYVFLNAIYLNTFTALDQLSVSRFDIEHIAPKKQMQNLIKACHTKDIGLPISCVANLCYLPEAANRSKGALNFYQDKKYLKDENLEDIENKYSFTTQDSLEWMDMPYENPNDFALLKEEYTTFLRKRFECLKRKFCKSLEIEYVEADIDNFEDTNIRDLEKISDKTINKRSDKSSPFIKAFSKTTGIELERIKGNSYRSIDKKQGFFISTSKDYHQGNRSKYWFAYRKNYHIDEFKEQFYLYGCDDPNTIICLPKRVIESYLDNLNVSVDEEGNISHWHIVFFKDNDGKMTMLLSKPEIKEIDITEYLLEKYKRYIAP